MTAKILLVDDEAAIREMIKFVMERHDFEVSCTEDSNSALLELADNKPDLLLLDWMLPDISGVDLAKRLKNDPAYQDIPIIMLTARGAENDKIRGLEIGADDYITKPFSPRELAARIKAVLRRTSPKLDTEILNFEKLQIDLKSHRVTIAGKKVTIGPTEFRLLQFFMTHTERVYSREQLLDRIWGSNVYIEERTVDVHIRRLRKALEPSGYARLIQTVRGAGYRFSAKD